MSNRLDAIVFNYTCHIKRRVDDTRAIAHETKRAFTPSHTRGSLPYFPAVRFQLFYHSGVVAGVQVLTRPFRLQRGRTRIEEGARVATPAISRRRLRTGAINNSQEADFGKYLTPIGKSYHHNFKKL